MGTLRIVSLNGRPVICEFEQKRVKNINVRVRDDGTLYCSYPRYVSQAEAERFIGTAADYLSNSIDKVNFRQAKSGRPVSMSLRQPGGSLEIRVNKDGSFVLSGTVLFMCSGSAEIIV